MAARLSAKRRPRYSLDFKLKAVKLTRLPGMEVQAVAEALDIHPVMLSRSRQEAREGRLSEVAPRPQMSKKLVREIAIQIAANGGVDDTEPTARSTLEISVPEIEISRIMAGT